MQCLAKFVVAQPPAPAKGKPGPKLGSKRATSKKAQPAGAGEAAGVFQVPNPPRVGLNAASAGSGGGTAGSSSQVSAPSIGRGRAAE